MQGLHINTYTQPTIPPVALMKGSFSKCYLRNSSRWLIYVINSIDNTKLPYARFDLSPVFLVALVAITETRGRMCDDKVEWKRGKWHLPSLLFAPF